MIDTLARHLAALSEARRLLTMVLQRNPSFEACREARARGGDSGPDRNGGSSGDIDATLHGDRYFEAYRHISRAIELLEPELASGSMPSAQRQGIGVIEVLPLAVSSGEKASSLAEALEAAHRELARRKTRPVRIDEDASSLGDSPADGDAARDQRVATEQELASIRAALGIGNETSAPERSPSVAPVVARSEVVEFASARGGATPPDTVSGPGAMPEPGSAPVPSEAPVSASASAEVRNLPSARVIDDALVYAAPKWTEASVEIVRSAVAVEPTREADRPRQSGGWFSRVAKTA